METVVIHSKNGSEISEGLPERNLPSKSISPSLLLSMTLNS